MYVCMHVCIYTYVHVLNHKHIYVSYPAHTHTWTHVRDQRACSCASCLSLPVGETGLIAGVCASVCILFRVFVGALMRTCSVPCIKQEDDAIL